MAAVALLAPRPPLPAAFRHNGGTACRVPPPRRHSQPRSATPAACRACPAACRRVPPPSAEHIELRGQGWRRGVPVPAEAPPPSPTLMGVGVARVIQAPRRGRHSPSVSSVMAAPAIVLWRRGPQRLW